jgi:carboxyl-terminal processing protease
MLDRKLWGARRGALAAALAVAVVALGAGAPVFGGGDENDASTRVAAAVADMERAGAAEIFTVSRSLDALGPAGTAAAKSSLETASPRARVGLARFLLGQKEQAAAIPVLEKTALSDDPVAAALAVQLIERSARSKDDVQSLRAVLEKNHEPAVRIAAAKALRNVGRDVSAERVLKDYLSSDDFDARAGAALALAEIGNVDAAKPVLAELEGEPTWRGDLARSYLAQEKLYDSLRSSAGLDQQGQVKLLEKQKKDLEQQLADLRRKLEAGGGSATGSELLDELLGKVQRYYVEDGDKLTTKNLVDEAAKGMIASLDPFSSYMTEKETKDFDDSMQGKYAGIGAVVQMDPKDKILTIIRPIYSGPAYRAGLRSLDKITEVEHEPTYGKTVEELVLKLKGEPRTPVRIKVYRRGWQKEREFTLEREEIQLQSVHYAMLPGKIGYLALSQFGQNAEQEVEAALQDLEAQGMRALVFDLRANPGGLLQAAVEIADKFLKGNKLIVYSEGRNPQIAPRREFHTHDGRTHPDYPMAVLVNRASASASEIVSGALQDWHRATLVGENTFGKGSVQQLMRVKATNDKSTLRLTIAKYYLPSGRCIHRDEKTGKGGIDPDVVVEMDNDPAWVIQEADKLLETQAVDRYVQELWRDHKEVLEELAVFDGFDASKYPGFDEWAKTLNTKLDREHLRKLVRAGVRRLVQDDRAKEFAYDLEEDTQLQRAIYEDLVKLGDDMGRYKEYAFFAQKFAKAPDVPAKAPPGGEVR